MSGLKNSPEQDSVSVQINNCVACDECKKYILKLIDILMGANTQTFDDPVMQHYHYIFDRETYYKISDLRDKLWRK